MLIVEDEAQMADVIRRALVRDGAAVDVAADGAEALELAARVDYDAIVLDVMLPGASGFDVCRRLRERGAWSPVLMLTALDGVHDRVAGLDSGADDYLVKPFALAELQARLRALVRRGRPERPAILRSGQLRLDPARREVYGWAAWSPGRGILTLRNPAPRRQTLEVDAARVFELPSSRSGRFRARRPWRSDRDRPAVQLEAGRSVEIALEPFEVATFVAEI